MKFYQRHGRQIKGEDYDEYTKDAVFVDITSSAEWWCGRRDASVDEIKEDIPCAVSPWPLCWIEYKMPQNARQGKEMIKLPLGYFGMHVEQWKIEKDDAEAVLRTDDGFRHFSEQGWFQPVDNYFQERRMSLIGDVIQQGRSLGWIMLSHSFFGNHHECKYLCTRLRYLDDDGEIMEPLTIGAYRVDQDMIPALISIENPVLFAFSLSHCKNVKMVDEPSVSPKVLEKRQKRGIPNIVFKTLVVEPLRQQVRREAAADRTGEQNQIKRALHIARGHFKDYRNGPGLFGKYQGLYWWDMHVRGSADAGVVVKDYQVKR